MDLKTCKREWAQYVDTDTYKVPARKIHAFAQRVEALALASRDKKDAPSAIGLCDRASTIRKMEKLAPIGITNAANLITA